MAFADFWQGFNPHDFILSAVLKERLNMVIVDNQDEADLLIYSVLEMRTTILKASGFSIRPNP